MTKSYIYMIVNWWEPNGIRTYNSEAMQYVLYLLSLYHAMNTPNIMVFLSQNTKQSLIEVTDAANKTIGINMISDCGRYNYI